MPDPTTPYAGLTKPTVGADDNTWGALLNTDLDLIDTFLRNIVPAGEMKPFAGASAPTGYLLCQGQAVSRTAYAALFAAIGTAWGVGDGSTTFNVPDMRDRVAVGAGGGYALASTGGAASATPTITVASHVLTTAEIPAHNHADAGHTHADTGHTHTDSGHGHSDVGHAHAQDGNTYINAPGLQVSAGSGINITAPGSNTGTGYAVIAPASANIQTSHAALAVSSANIQNTGGGGGHNHTATASSVSTVPPYAAVNYIIKT